MRYRFGNPFRESHGHDMYVYDFVAQPTDPHSVNLAIEYVVPELTTFGRGTVLKERVWIVPMNQIDKPHFEEREVYMQDYDPNKQGWVNSCVWISWKHDFIRDEPCLYVAIGCYTRECSGKQCVLNHSTHELRRAPKLVSWQLDAIKEEIGEHPRLRLGIRQDKDNEVLHELGFTRIDAPLKALVG